MNILLIQTIVSTIHTTLQFQKLNNVEEMECNIPMDKNKDIYLLVRDNKFFIETEETDNEGYTDLISTEIEPDKAGNYFQSVKTIIGAI